MILYSVQKCLLPQATVYERFHGNDGEVKTHTQGRRACKGEGDRIQDAHKRLLLHQRAANRLSLGWKDDTDPMLRPVGDDKVSKILGMAQELIDTKDNHNHIAHLILA